MAVGADHNRKISQGGGVRGVSVRVEDAGWADVPERAYDDGVSPAGKHRMGDGIVSDQEGKSGFDLGKLDESSTAARHASRRAQGSRGRGRRRRARPGRIACGSSGGTSASASPSAAGAPKKGGHIRSAIGGGSAKDTLDAQLSTTETQIITQWQIYDSLMGWDPEHKLDDAARRVLRAQRRRHRAHREAQVGPHVPRRQAGHRRRRRVQLPAHPRPQDGGHRQARARPVSSRAASRRSTTSRCSSRSTSPT